jgi:acyl-CoA thioester hydrolase
MSPTPARIRIGQRVERADADPSGAAGWRAIVRFGEVTERVMHTALGIVEETFGYTPRLRVALEFHRPLRPGDEVQVELAVTSVGRSSVGYRLTVGGPDGTTAADGEIVTCLVEPDGARSRPWPDHIRRALAESGELTAVV